ncbi:zinc carboxypeptidase domain protein [Vibrio astriarenae]|nr:zinc carboxypeptidase domain protein [Vibrio sp. C7]
MKIFSNFESGNINVVSADSPQDIQLTIQRITKPISPSGFTSA